MSTTFDLAVPESRTRDTPPELEQARLLRSRLLAALRVLGVDDAVPSGWVTPVCSGWYFSPFTHHQARRLVTALEGLGASGSTADDDRCRPVTGPGPGPGPGQLTFAFGDRRAAA